MPATSGFQAGQETNTAIVSYGIESVWATLPVVAFQQIRLTSDGLTRTKTRARPTEINPSGEVVAAVTTQDVASGSIGFALSFGTYDDFLSVVLKNDWQAKQVISGAAGDITFTNASASTGTLTSSTSNKFQNIAQGQWIKLLGFSNAVNNNYWFVQAKASNTSLTLKGSTSPLTETPAGAAAQVRASTIQNGTQFKSLYTQKRFSSTLFLVYPGCFIDGFTLQGAVGKFLDGTFTVMAQTETNKTTDSSTGAVLAAPTGTVNSPVGDFKGVFLNEAALGAIADSFSISCKNTGAAADFGLGSALAQGMRMGLLEATGTLRVYFKDFTLYTLFINETGGRIEFITEDDAGNGYVITLLNAKIMNPKVVIGGPNQPVYATFDLEGNPVSGGAGTIQIDRLPAT